jgi:hypothetical protein
MSDRDRTMIVAAHQRAAVTVRMGATTVPATLTGWHAGDTRRGPCARVVLVGGRTRTVPQEAVVLP